MLGWRDVGVGDVGVGGCWGWRMLGWGMLGWRDVKEMVELFSHVSLLYVQERYEI